MIISYFTTSKILDFFLLNYELYVWSIFFGLILGSLYVLIKRTNKTNVKKLLILFVGLCFGLLLSFQNLCWKIELWYLFSFVVLLVFAE